MNEKLVKMRTLYLLSVFTFFLVSCSQETEVTQEQEVQTTRPLIERKNGVYKEWYPGHQQVKIQGREDDKGRRNGIWKLYSEQGVELSITVYTDDKKDGHIVVRYPNSVVHYVGEYMMDERVGEWRFYDEQGTLVKTENYGYPETK